MRVAAHGSHLEVHVRDGLWSQDAMEAFRGAPEIAQRGGGDAGNVQVAVIREVASTRTIDVTVGPPAQAVDIIAQLERVRVTRGVLPLVYATDNGTYCAAELDAYLAEHQVVHLRNVPHTPQHNPWVERGHRDLREEAGLPKGGPPLALAECAARLDAAWTTLDDHRRRRTRGYQTAANFELALPAATGVCSRAGFYKATCRAVASATAALETDGERRRAEREAILSTLESFGIVTRTRGGSPVPTSKSASLT